MEKVSNKDKHTLVMNILVTILLGVVTLNGVLHHEVWADEAQVWLLVKNLSFAGLLNHLPNEGHPPFFYMLIMPFAKLGFSIMTMKIICWFASIAGVFCILQYSPFNKFAKYALVLSAGYLYFFPVIARSYSILAFLIPLLAMLYPKKDKHPYIYALVLSLIGCTHIIMYVFVGILALYFLYDTVIVPWKALSREKKKHYLYSFFIIVISMLFVAFLLLGTPGSNAAIELKSKNILGSIGLVLPQIFINIVDYTVMKTYSIFALTLVAVIILVCFTFFSFVQLFLQNKRIFALVLLAILFQIAIYVFWYRAFVYPTRIAIAYLILVFGFWVVMDDSDYYPKFKIDKPFWLNLSLGIMFTLTIFNGARYYITDLFYYYSSAKPTAEFIQKNIPENAVIAVTNDPFSLGLYYYLPKGRLWSNLKKGKIDYVVWDYSLNNIYIKKNWSRIIKREFAKELKENPKKPIYVIFTIYSDYSKNEIFPASNFRTIYKSPPSIAEGERYLIYEFIEK